MGECFSEFNASEAGKALGAEPRTLRDTAHGDGEALTVGDTVLEVYRDAGFARVTTADARIELYRVPGYAVSGERVVFEQGEQDHRSRLLVGADGKVAFLPVLRGPEPPTTPGTAPTGEQDTTPPSGSSGGAAARHDTPAAGGSAPHEQGEREQRQLQGRLGRDPWYSDQGEQPVAGFPLAVNDNEGKTTWHRVVVVGEVAEQVNAALKTGQIKKGRLVQVSGSEVARKEDNGHGGTRTITEFQAARVVRTRSSTVPQPHGR